MKKLAVVWGLCVLALLMDKDPAHAQSSPLPILEAGICNTPTGFPATIGRGRTPPGKELVKITLSSPDAVCNDGSPAVIYVRGANPNAPAEANKWVIFLQGGGGCGDYESCSDRWCGRDAFGASKMSTMNAPDTVGTGGLLLRHTSNRFGDRNQVFAYYCSSDSWHRSVLDKVLEHPDDPNRAYSLHFKGSDIVKGIIAELEGGVADDEGQPLLPDINEAEDILLAGTSAGANGVRHNADRLRDQLTATNPNLVFRAVPDAAFLPLSPEAEDFLAQQSGVFAKGVNQETADHRPDVSCVTGHPGQAALCLDTSFVQMNHMTTPFFIHMDLVDINAFKHIDLSRFESKADFARYMHDQISALKDIPMPGGSIESEEITVQPGIYAPLCGNHGGLLNNALFFDPKVTPDTGGAPLSYHELLWNWMIGLEPTIQIAVKPLPSPASPVLDTECGPPSATNGFASLNSASYAVGEPVTPDSIVSGFGQDLALGVVSAEETPLPTELGGTRVEVTDSEGVTHLAQLFYVAPTQINYLMPAAVALGFAVVTVYSGTGSVSTGEVEIGRLGPGLYTANAQGSGVAAALSLRIDGNGARTLDLVFNEDLSPKAIDLDPPDDQVYLILFGTGFRLGSQARLAAYVGGISVPVLAAVAQGQFDGEDQANIGPLPRVLAGRGQVPVVLEVGGERTNMVGVAIQ